MSAVLMNALAWLSYGIYPLLNKPVMIIEHLTNIKFFTYKVNYQILNAPEIKARVLPSDEFLLGHALQASDEEGNLKMHSNC